MHAIHRLAMDRESRRRARSMAAACFRERLMTLR